MLERFLTHMAVFSFLVLFFTLNLAWCFMCLRAVKYNVPPQTTLAFINDLKPPLNWYYFYFSGTESLKYVYTSLNVIRLQICVSIFVILIGSLIFVDDAQSTDTNRQISGIFWLVVTFVMLLGLRVWRFGKKLEDVTDNG